MQKMFLGLLVLIVFSGCTTLDSDMILIDDANYFADLNVSDANFTDLNDTPNSYAGEAAKCVAVKGTEDGLEFIVCASGFVTDTTLDVNADALASFLSKSYDWNADQNFLVSNIFDLNLGQDHFSVNGTDFNVFDLNYSIRSVCSGDANSVLTSAGLCQDITDFHLSGGTGGISDGNVYSIGIISKDTNAFLIDLNMNSKNIYKVKDLNVNQDANISRNLIVGNDLNALRVFVSTGDLNFFVYDKNIIMQTANGMVIAYPDENKLCVGSDPNARACQWVSCSGGDCNAFFGFG